MKRIVFLSAALLFVSMTLTSCFKTRTCECRSASHPELNENVSVGPGSKSKAVSDCENQQFSYVSSYPDYTCSLK